MLSVVVTFMISARSQHLTNLTDHGDFKFDLIQLIIHDHLANMTVTTTRHVVGDNCGSELLSSPTSAISEDHAQLYHLQLRHYVQLRLWVNP